MGTGPTCPQEPAESGGAYPTAPDEPGPIIPLKSPDVDPEGGLIAYEEVIPGTDMGFTLLPIPGGTFKMGSPPDEQDRGSGESPQHEVEVAPFWMGRYEVTWAEYHAWQFKLDQARRQAPGPSDPWADAVSRPTPPYVPMDFEMGIEGCPAVCMTQLAAKQYTRWLSMKTGRFYRLPTEAEWEYACRAGTVSAYSFGEDVDDLEDHAWFFDNGDDRYHPVGQKKANPWGLFDMHGNVAEWVLDAYDAKFYGNSDSNSATRVNWPTALYPRVVRGGSWDSDPEDLRSAARLRSKKGWKVQDPQLPKSIWYHTDASFVGFRVVRPLTPPGPEERDRYWEADLESIRTIQLKQRQGGR
jgi:formylglycine-generating enzyme required for sulfatase activity